MENIDFYRITDICTLLSIGKKTRYSFSYVFRCKDFRYRCADVLRDMGVDIPEGAWIDNRKMRSMGLMRINPDRSWSVPVPVACLMFEMSFPECTMAAKREGLSGRALLDFVYSCKGGHVDDDGEIITVLLYNKRKDITRICKSRSIYRMNFDSKKEALDVEMIAIHRGDVLDEIRERVKNKVYVRDWYMLAKSETMRIISDYGFELIKSDWIDMEDRKIENVVNVSEKRVRQIITL